MLCSTKLSYESQLLYYNANNFIQDIIYPGIHRHRVRKNVLYRYYIIFAVVLCAINGRKDFYEIEGGGRG